MSSATSIDRSFRLKSEATAKRSKQGGQRDPGQRPDGKAPDAQVDEAFKPWHFFVLASLMAATAAVVMVRQSTPENLILISFTIGAAGFAAAGFYRMLAPLAAEDVSMFSEPLTERSRAALEREKMLVLRAIKELEFDRAMGKVSPKDFEEMSARLRTRAIALIRQLDEGGSAYRQVIERELASRLAVDRSTQATPVPETAEPAPTAVPELAEASRGMCTCGTANDPDAAFCKRCGAQLS